MITLVILNFNGADTLKASIDSVFLQTAQPDKFFVIDNASTDHSRNIAVGMGVEVVDADNRYKYITGLNTALGLCEDRLIFMQNDVVLSPTFIEGMQSHTFFERDFVAQPVIYDFNGNIDNFGMDLVWPGYGINRKSYSDNDAGYCSSVVFMIDKEAIMKNGYYDPIFSPAYLEDLDYSLRCRRNGTKQILVPEAIAHHMGNHTFSSTYKKLEISRLIRRNRSFFIMKNYSGLDRFVRSTVASCRDVAKETVDVITNWWVSKNHWK